MMLIFEIALGIVLAVFILRYLSFFILGGVLIAAVCVVGIVAIFAWAFLSDRMDHDQFIGLAVIVMWVLLGCFLMKRTRSRNDVGADSAPSDTLPP